MRIKEYLEKSRSRLLYPESYHSWQIKAAEKILKIFQDIDIDTEEELLGVCLQDPNTVVILSTSIPRTIRCDKPPFTLIIRKIL